MRHEGYHQYLDRVMPDPPVWFNEGLAVYHENGIKEDGTREAVMRSGEWAFDI